MAGLFRWTEISFLVFTLVDISCCYLVLKVEAMSLMMSVHVESALSLDLLAQLQPIQIVYLQPP